MGEGRIETVTSKLNLKVTKFPLKPGFLYNHFVTEEDNKAGISIPGDTTTVYFSWNPTYILRSFVCRLFFGVHVIMRDPSK
jgi:hypothetical protein